MIESFLKSAVSLEPFTQRDIISNDNYLNWMNDFEVTKYNSHGVFPYTLDDAFKYTQHLKENKSQVAFKIISADETWIGNASIQDINLINRSADLAIFIGDVNYWGKGIATEVFGMLIMYGFQVLNLHRLTAGVITENIGMMRVCEKVGMINEGIRQEVLYKNGVYLNAAMFAILRRDS